MQESGTPVHILVVDDEPDLELLIRQRFRRKLRDGEFSFIFAANGAEALEIIDRGEHLDLVLSDINMPVMDGLTFLARLRERGREDLKTVIVSAYGDMGNIRTAMNRGAFDFVTKPIDFEDLEITIEKTLAHVRGLRKAEEDRRELERVSGELEVARRIQQAIIPTDYPPFPGHETFTLYAEMRPARQVGGDFYDYFIADGRRLVFAIADVAGKGVPAGLIMSATRALLKVEAARQSSPAACLGAINSHLSGENLSSMFVSLFLGSLDVREGFFRYASAGHSMPYLLSGTQIRQIPRARGAVLGVDSQSQYVDCELPLEAADVLFLCTDGITEAFNGEKEEYGEHRLQSLLPSLASREVRGLVQAVMTDVQRFAGNAGQSDDMTAMALRFDGLSRG